MHKVSIVIPAYNEEAFIGELLKVILSVDLSSVGFEREIIVVDDGSKDRTYEIASKFEGVRCIQQKNQGKGRAVQNGIKEATGDYVLVQDADLEYHPTDYPKLLAPLTKSKGRLSTYGSRTLGQMEKKKFSLFPGRHPEQSIGPWGANIILSLWCFILYGRYITDTLTGYKIYPTKILRGFNVKTHGFETDHELTAKLLRSGVKIKEIPIEYTPRTVEEGKKIGISDFFKALLTFARFRFVSKKNF